VPPGRSDHRIPDGRRVYAIGDIHGRLDLLDVLRAAVMEDARRAPPRNGAIAVYLGDYVDRGEDSAGAVERLIEEPLAGLTSVHLKGNHEAMLLDFLDDPRDAQIWLANGGGATLASYGVELPEWPDWAAIEEGWKAFRAAIPQSHLSFFRALRLSHGEGDYYFCHAGVRPGRPLDRQGAQDLTWIRDEFLDSDADFGKRIVHGHSIVPEPQILPNRIAIDTGAWYSGRLSAVVLEGAECRFLSTEPPD